VPRPVSYSGPPWRIGGARDSQLGLVHQPCRSRRAAGEPAEADVPGAQAISVTFRASAAAARGPTTLSWPSTRQKRRGDDVRDGHVWMSGSHSASNLADTGAPAASASRVRSGLASLPTSLGSMMRSMSYCPLCDMDRGQCVHGLADRRRTAGTERLLISPANLAHFPGCDHKDDDDYSEWAELDIPNAWERLGNGGRLAATGGARPDRVATGRCKDCVAHGPW
jgi:hypothetical protein